MSLIHSTEVAAPIDDVFGWHQRPGAVDRLTPPWQPVRVVAEADSIRDGRAVLALPGPLRWVAQHDADGYRPPRQFVDQLTSGLLGSVLSWRHTHEFAAVSEKSTRVTDIVQTPLPAAMLRSMFEYRHRQLADDLAANERARKHDDAPLAVAVTGSSGLVGKALTAALSTAGHRVVRLVRRPASASGERQWDPTDPAPDLLDGVDAVVHLAGAPIAGRFTDRHKQQVYGSRVGPTRKLAQLAADSDIRTFVSASAIGYYGPDRGDERLAESSESGAGFLAELVQDWEADCEPARAAGLRVVNVRTGVVQSPSGGMLRLLWPIFAAGLGGRIGDGMQWMAWIGIDDVVDIYHRALLDDAMAGPVNAVAPNAVRNDEYTRTLGHVLRRPTVLPVPAIGPRLLLANEGAREVARANQRVEPRWLVEHDHVFRQPTLEAALSHVLGKTVLT
ncbi:TIGR01777 family oxidoreductase [Nocardioidaceae bacterium SCSIO 66511]|nr:TIGR01777 family oxidoreductase [Nocardioidaceae bacterium SCSIO 66511]